MDRLKALLKARTPLIWLQTPEEPRAEYEVKHACEELDRPLYVWRLTTGITQMVDPPQTDSDVSPSEVFSKMQEDHVWLLEDFDVHLEDPQTARQLKDAWTAHQAQAQPCCVVILTFAPVPEPLKHLAVHCELPLPDDGALLTTLQAMSEKAGDESACVRSARGLTVSEAEQAFAVCYAAEEAITPEGVHGERVAALRQNQALQFVTVDQGLDDIGGLAAAKEWLLKRAKAYSPEAREYGLPEPRGVLYIGIPGSGKSMICKAASLVLKLPLLRLDLGAIYGSLVGQSEERLREVLKTIDAIRGCVLWCDEIERASAGAGSGISDGGTSSRVIGTLLTWMQERQPGTFLALTANNIASLPPELMRKGR